MASTLTAPEDDTLNLSFILIDPPLIVPLNEAVPSLYSLKLFVSITRYPVLNVIASDVADISEHSLSLLTFNAI